MRKVLLDANLLIGSLDESGTTSRSQRDEAKLILNKLLSDENVTLVITPLIRYEVLRGISWDNQENYIKLKQVLDGHSINPAAEMLTHCRAIELCQRGVDVLCCGIGQLEDTLID